MKLKTPLKNKNEVELIFTKEAKGFFLWKAPTSDNSYLIGLGRKDIYSKYYLDSFLKENNIKGKIKPCIVDGLFLISLCLVLILKMLYWLGMQQVILRLQQAWTILWNFRF